MKNLFWKKQDLVFADPNTPSPKLEHGITITHITDLNTYVLIAGPGNAASTQPANPQPKPQEPVKKNPFGSKGGFTAPVEKPLPLIDSVYILDGTTLKWRIQECTGKMPTRRLFYYCAYQAPNLIFSYGSDKKPCNDLYTLNVQNWVWRKLFFFPDAPPAQLHGAFVVLKDKKYLIGGTKIPESSNNMQSEIWSLSFENVNWDVKTDGVPGGLWAKAEWTNPDAQWAGLKYFSANAVDGDESIFIFGGFTLENEVSGKCFLYTPKEKVIKVIQTKGQKPSPRGKHRALTLKKDIICVYGGQPSHDLPALLRYDIDFYLYHHATATWEKPMTGGNPPMTLDFFCFASNGSESLNEIILLGYGQSGDPAEQYSLAELKKEEEYSFTKLPGPASTTTIVPVASALNTKKITSAFSSNNSNFDIARHNNSIEAELNEGVRLTQSQKAKIEQLEQTLVKLRAQNNIMKSKIQKQNEQLKRGEEQLAVESEKMIGEDSTPMRGGNSAERHHQELNPKLLSLLIMEHKKRKFLEVKSEVLQNTIKDAEKLVVALDGFSEEESKAEHIRVMKEFRNRIEDIWNKEKLLRKEVNSRFHALDIDIKKKLEESCNEQERKILKLGNSTKN